MDTAQETCEPSPSEDTRALVVWDGRPHLPAVQAVEAEPWDETTPRAVLWGVDTLYMSFDLPVSEEMWAQLEYEQQTAKEIAAERRAVHCPEWLDAIMRPTGAKGGYRYLIETDAWSIKLLRDVPNRPPIFVELRAFALKTHPRGVIGLCEEVCNYLRRVLLSDQDTAAVAAAVNVDIARCSRLDLHCDWQGGWHPTLHEGEDRLFIRPGKVDWHPYMSGNVCTGYIFGKGNVSARIYNKTRQVRQKHLDWYFTLLAQHNGLAYNPQLDVWRLEFELTRAGVKGFRIATQQEITDPDEVIEAELDAEELPHIGTVRKALHWAGRVWSYLTKRWLRLVVSTGDANRGRWPTHPTWGLLHEAFANAMLGAHLPDAQLQLVRAERHSGYKRFLDRVAVGVLGAADLYDTDTGAVAGSWLAYQYRLAYLIRRKQEERATAWTHVGRPERAQAARRGMGASVARLKKVEELLGMTLGVFTSSGVVPAQLPHVATVADFLCTIIDDLESVATAKGGIGHLLHDKRCKVYKAYSSRGMFKQAA